MAILWPTEQGWIPLIAVPISGPGKLPESFVEWLWDREVVAIIVVTLEYTTREGQC
jgi:hypothetical protein